MEITNEIKAKIFAVYLGANVQLPKLYNFSGLKTTSETGALRGINTGFIAFMGIPAFYPVSDFKLILKPLSAITDEDAIAVSKIIKDEQGGIESGKLFAMYFKEKFTHAYDVLWANMALQYLQSKGYDLPHYLLGGKTLQEAGLAIYETETIKQDS